MRVMRHTDARLTMVDYVGDEQLYTMDAIDTVRKLSDRNKPDHGDRKLGG
jgi:hypothetical protein